LKGRAELEGNEEYVNLILQQADFLKTIAAVEVVARVPEPA